MARRTTTENYIMATSLLEAPGLLYASHPVPELLAEVELESVAQFQHSLVIITDSWWTPAIEEQPEDWCHRLGQVTPSSPQLPSDTRKQQSFSASESDADYSYSLDSNVERTEGDIATCCPV